MLILPLDILIPVPALKWALTSLALGPVYVNAPDVLLYVKLPSPPASVTETAPLARASVYCVIEFLNSVPTSVKPVPAVYVVLVSTTVSVAEVKPVTCP